METENERIKAFNDARKKREAEDKINRSKYQKASKSKANDNFILNHILKIGKQLINYHCKTAQDRVVQKRAMNHNGKFEYEEYELTHEERVSHLDNAAGVQELVDYIERQLRDDPKPIKPKEKVKKEE